MILNSGKTIITPPASLTAYLLKNDSIAEPNEPAPSTIGMPTSDATGSINEQSHTASYEFSFNNSDEIVGTYSSMIMYNNGTPFARLTFAPVIKTGSNKLTFTYTFYY